MPGSTYDGLVIRASPPHLDRVVVNSTNNMTSNGLELIGFQMVREVEGANEPHKTDAKVQQDEAFLVRSSRKSFYKSHILV